jgi:integrase
MSVRKREWVTRKGEQKTAWVADFVDNAGRRQIRTFDKKKDADAFYSKVRVDINAGTHVTIDGDKTVADACDDWIKGVAADGRERGTTRMYQFHAKCHIVPHIGNVKLAKLTQGHVQHFRDKLLQGEHKLSHVMASKVWISFRQMLKASHCGHITDNVKPIRAPSRKKDELAIPTPAEAKRIIAAASDNPKLVTFLRMAMLTGLRVSELLGLRWKDIDFKRHEVHVKQRADRFRVIGALKTDSSRRTVPIGPDLVHVLKTWKLACPPGEADLVFPTRDGVVQHYENIRRAVDTLLVKAAVVNKAGKPKYSIHDFRHFFASWCINAKDHGGRELPAKLVQTWLGHSSIKMTLDIYGHLFPQAQDSMEVGESEKALFG